MISLNFHLSPGSTATIARTVLCLVLSLQVVAVSSSYANPLTGRSTPAPQSISADRQQEEESVLSDVIARITILQMKIKQRIAAHVRDFKKDGKIAPLLPLFLLALGYGVIHAAGPGHGKAIAMTYALARDRSYKSGLWLGTLIAVIHAGSAVTVVFLLRVIMEKAITTSLESATRVTQIASYSLICLIGMYIFISGIRALFAKDTHHQERSGTGKRFDNPLTAALAIGIVPCPGVIMILLFCLSLDQAVLGLLLCCTVSAGMALTITLAVWLSLAGKQLTLKASSGTQAGLHYAEPCLHCLSGLVLTGAGGLLLAASI